MSQKIYDTYNVLRDKNIICKTCKHRKRLTWECKNNSVAYLNLTKTECKYYIHNIGWKEKSYE